MCLMLQLRCDGPWKHFNRQADRFYKHRELNNYNHFDTACIALPHNNTHVWDPVHATSFTDEVSNIPKNIN